MQLTKQEIVDSLIKQRYERNEVLLSETKKTMIITTRAYPKTGTNVLAIDLSYAVRYVNNFGSRVFTDFDKALDYYVSI